MTELDRRTLIAGLAISAASLSGEAHAQTPAPGAQGQRPAPPQSAFSFDDVVRRARDVSSAPYESAVQPLPEQLTRLDFDGWREIRFRSDRSMLGGAGGKFRLQLFHLGHLFLKPVTINIVRDGVATPIPYTASLFDYGRAKFDKPLPVNMGFAGFRVHYPLNDPRGSDELLSFIGSSYFRWLGRAQKYGLSARGLALGTGLLDNKEEFPFFREFWLDTPDANTDSITIYALLDSPSVSGAYKFVFHPGPDSPVDIEATLFPRKPLELLGMAPLTSMYFLGENDRHMNAPNKYDEFRAELHDSDGLLMLTVDQEWVWRPLKNPLVQEVQRFDARNIRGFGLMQRDRRYEHYQDIELAYEDRPSYWIEPKEDWGSGVVELVELATRDETADNIVVAFVPDSPLEPGKPFTFSYRIRSLNDGLDLHKLGYVGNTFAAPAFALGSNEQQSANTRRFMVDFTGGDMDYYLKNPSLLKVVASARNAKVFRTFLVPNPKGKGFRAMIDVRLEENQVGTMRAHLQAGQKPVTETWSYSWRIYNF